MKIPYPSRELVVAALLLSCFAAGATAQQPSQQQDGPALSPATHSARYPEVMCVHCIVPQKDHGYLLHLEIDKDPAVVAMYDRDGVLGARLEPDAAKVSLSAAAATHAGGILAVGGGVMGGFGARTEMNLWCIGMEMVGVSRGQKSWHLPGRPISDLRFATLKLSKFRARLSP
jgi:hypothetical protein